jgi:hypothetical protein
MNIDYIARHIHFNKTERKRLPLISNIVTDIEDVSPMDEANASAYLNTTKANILFKFVEICSRYAWSIPRECRRGSAASQVLEQLLK